MIDRAFYTLVVVAASFITYNTFRGGQYGLAVWNFLIASAVFAHLIVNGDEP